MRERTAWKLSEARFFLERLAEREGKDDFRYYLSAVLNAASGALDVMRGEYGPCPGFGAWYDREVVPRRKARGDLHWFIAQRDQVQHHRTLTLRAEEEEVGFMPTEHPNPRRPRLRAPVTDRRSHVLPGHQVIQRRPRWYFEARPGEDAWLICDTHLGKIAAIAVDCHQRFG